ncbi:outer membrane beta-barrel protein [Lutibacter sp.]|uniref:outer membrane beta-barrel protein n=1 Tax=Lutibacter sp. TaxID=1925666 RepID=UPI0027341770|nr:outer membrane beta-barrel protein [Lutibacter sp.]MDP3313218.1 outer membrane beta-barrel protein [Lutibacter sp.]
MKKITGLFCCLLLFHISLTAQEFVVGLKGGINYNAIGELYHIGTANGGGNNVIPTEDFYYQADKDLGNHFGLFLNIKFDKIFIRSEMNFTTAKNSYPLSQKIANWNSSKVDIPILLGVRLYDPIWIYAGPIFSVVSDMELEGVEYPIVFNKSSFDVGIGLLVDFGRFGVDFRYQYGISPVDFQRVDIVRSIYGTNVAHLLEYNSSQLSISLHINLLKINGSEKRNRSGSGWRNHQNL